MKVGKLFDSFNFFQTFEIMKGTTAENGLKATASIKLHWAIPEKKSNRRFSTWNFQGY